MCNSKSNGLYICTRSVRSVSPSDATLRRLQSRLETRSPGLSMLTAGGRTSPSVYFGQSRDGSIHSLNGNDKRRTCLARKLALPRLDI